jgi:transposase
MTSNFWIGLDVGEESTAVCVLDEAGDLVLECCASPLAADIADCLDPFPLSSISSLAMETGSPPNLAAQLAKLGFPVAVFDAGKASKVLSLRRQKTDANDARGIAEIARLGGVPRIAVHVRGTEAQQIRMELALRHRLVWVQTATRNCLRSMLRNYGSSIRQLGSGAAMNPKIEAEMEALARGGVSDAARTLRPLINLCTQLHVSIRGIDKDLKKRAETNPVTGRFLKIPGVGPICALSFYAAIDEPSRFRRPTDVGPYLGMVPKLKQSGRALRRSGISRAGDRLTRCRLVMSAGVMMSRAAERCALAEWGTELAKRSGYGRARVAVGRKLAVVMLTMWQTDKDFAPYPARN